MQDNITVSTNHVTDKEKDNEQTDDQKMDGVEEGKNRKQERETQVSY